MAVLLLLSKQHISWSAFEFFVILMSKSTHANRFTSVLSVETLILLLLVFRLDIFAVSIPAQPICFP